MASDGMEHWWQRLTVPARAQRLSVPTWSRRALAVLLPFVAVSGVAAGLSSSADLTAVSAPLLGVSVTMAIFAVNLPFLAFQLSPYRAVAPGVPNRLYVGAVGATLLSVLPIASLAVSRATAARTAVAVIPVLAFVALALVRLAQEEGSASAIIARLAAARRSDEFAIRFAAAVRAQFARNVELERGLEAGKDQVPPPMHEITHEPLPPPVADDPLQGLVQLGRAAVAREDLVAFQQVTSTFFEVAESLAARTFDEVDDVPGWRVEGAMRDLIYDRLYGLAAGLDRDTNTQPMAEGFVENCADHVRDAFRRGASDSDLTRGVAGQGVGLLHRLMGVERRGPSFISMLTALRQVNELALRQQPEFMIEHRLAGYASRVIGLGETAIALSDSEGLYRCLETLAWMGCAAVRYDAAETGRRTAEAIVQLGRHARADDVDCFWERCSRTPYDHAVEHLSWMVSWIPRSTNGRAWLGVLGHAASRMQGVTMTLELDESTDPPTITVQRSTTPHLESVDDHGVLRTYDYSDPAMVDEFPLH